MWLKKCTCFLLAWVAVFCCLFTPVSAAEIGEQKVEIEERRASGKFDFDIPAKTLMKASSSFPMEYGETVTITANSIEELMKKIEDYSFAQKSDNVQTAQEKMIGQRVDFRG